MQVKLYEKLKNKKEILKNLLDKHIDFSLREEEILDKWTEYNPKRKDNFSVLVSDGSLNIRQYLGFYLMVFGGYGYFYDVVSREKDEFFTGDITISVAKKPEVAKSYLSLLMFLAEVKSIYRLYVLKKPDLIVFDGTLTSRLITPFPRSEWFIKSDEAEDYTNNIARDIFDSIDKRTVENYEDIYSLSGEVRELIIQSLDSSKQRLDYIEAIQSKLAYYEFMYLLYKIFNIKDSDVIGVAKTSSGVDIFKASVPDIKLFSKYIKTYGYSQVVVQDVQKLKSSFGNIPNDIANYLSDLNIFSTYSKYADRRFINLIEFYQHSERDSVNIEDTIDKLYSISFDGYPFLLKKVDNEVRITQEDMDFIIRELGLERAITGREVL
ncbi:MAG: DNA double-strand break repair nuclease NurA [Hydrogenothermaceae bacterium]|nr:DNA double-strand break repair nuclease NurA [Hydrogenothermaceae bacterium]